MEHRPGVKVHKRKVHGNMSQYESAIRKACGSSKVIGNIVEWKRSVV
jgi:hypothetical protein